MLHGDVIAGMSSYDELDHEIVDAELSRIALSAGMCWQARVTSTAHGVPIPARSSQVTTCGGCAMSPTV
jgi:hypothetical protein